MGEAGKGGGDKQYKDGFIRFGHIGVCARDISDGVKELLSGKGWRETERERERDEVKKTASDSSIPS